MKTKLKTVNISASIPIELLERLKNIAAKDERPQSYYIKKALEQYLEDFEDYLEGKQIYDEYKREGKPGISWEEMKKKI
jgi:RHH-type rel operon transcriptional repressor/antitoxin RelB